MGFYGDLTMIMRASKLGYNMIELTNSLFAYLCYLCLSENGVPSLLRLKWE